MSYEVFPWFFRRDEFDLLEETFDQLIQAHEIDTNIIRRAKNEKVLQEQLATEEKTEQRLLIQQEILNLTFQGQNESLKKKNDLNIREIIELEKERDPLYVQAYVWAAKVLKWSQKNNQHTEVFRVKLNTCLVPIKIALAGIETNSEDGGSSEIAVKEILLATTYLERVIESLKIATVDHLAIEGIELKKHFLAQQKILVGRY